MVDIIIIYEFNCELFSCKDIRSAYFLDTLINKIKKMCCVICDEFKPSRFDGCCPCCCKDIETEYVMVECDCCEGLGFFPISRGLYLSALEYGKLSYYEKALIEKEICLECNGKGEIELEK